MTNPWLFVIGAVILAMGIIVATMYPRVGLWLQGISLLPIGLSSVLVLVTGHVLGSSFLGTIHPTFGIDRLSAFFVIVITCTALPILLFATQYVVDNVHPRVIAPLTGLFVGMLIMVVVARDLSTFLTAWELMTLIPAVAILTYHLTRPVRRAVFIYLASTHLGSVGVWVALLILAHYGAMSSSHLFSIQSQSIQIVVWIAAIIGFGTKAGIMPMHSWLPRAHPIAPAHFSALMSAVMLKVALYGLIRVLWFWATPVPAWVGAVVIAIGAISSVGGVLYALFEHDIKRLLAFHSIENIGIITMGLGAALLFQVSHQPTWAAIAFAAALFHVFNHAAFKGLLFIGSGAIEQKTHTHAIDHMGNLIRSMPWTAGAFLIGCMAIAGLPPLNGFASEWLTAQSLAHIAMNGASISWMGVIGAAALAATAALAVLCFVKVIGLVLLGSSRVKPDIIVTDVTRSMRIAQWLLAGVCIAAGLFPGVMFALILPIIQSTTHTPVGALNLPKTGGLPALNICIMLIFVGGGLRYLRSRRATVSAPTWVCGQIVTPSLNWTSTAFTMPLRLTLQRFLRATSSFTTVKQHGVVQSAQYRSAVPQLIDTAIYAPAIHATLTLARKVRTIQSGSIQIYALSFAGVVALLLLLVRIGVLR